MATQSLTANPIDVHRRWSRPFAITLSDTVTDRNLQYNRIPYKWIHNAGTSGFAYVTYDPDNSTATKVKLYIPQGGFVEGGQWANALSTDATVGMEWIGLVGDENYDP